MLKTCSMTSLMTDHLNDNLGKRPKYDYNEDGLDAMECVHIDSWKILQPILENDIYCDKIPSSDVAVELLAKWFQLIAGDKDKLQMFRQWIKTSPGGEKDLRTSPSPNQFVPIAKLAEKRGHFSIDVPDPKPLTISPSKAASIDYINNEIPITPRSTPQVLLLQQLLQQQQHQIATLQQLRVGNDSMAVVPTASTITIVPTSGSAGVVLTVYMKNSPQWHPFTETCSCTCGFTSLDGSVNSTHRILGGNDGEMRFVVPPVSFPSQGISQIQMAVHLTSCTASHSPLVCADSFMYGRERAMLLASSDEDCEIDSPDSSVCDDEDNEDDGDREHRATQSASPKQLMTVRERMLEFIHSGTAAKSTTRIVLMQAPPNRVVWKNRRLDTPFKIRVEGTDTSAIKLTALALVVDHKGKLQIDAMENFDEECNNQGVALFHNLRMTKGTWGKEWSITFVVVTKSSLTSNNPAVVGVSPACPVVVKTRKNPQIRHINRSDTPSPLAFVERKPDTSVRKRNRVEDILDHNTVPAARSQSPIHPHPLRTSSGSHSEAMSNLLYAAEIKQQQQEREYRPPTTALPASIPAIPPSPPRNQIMLPSMQGGFASPDPNFANLQGLLGYLEEIKNRHHPNLSVIEQPPLKRDGKVLIVKKGKPFRTPFRLQMRTTPPAHGSRSNYNPALDYNSQQYVCVAVLRNDKGEEVALKNCEVLFDARGHATFPGLMVMKGTWGKAVQLTFEARWSGARRITGGNNWPPLRMLVVSETPALQLMCYTKDKKVPSAV